ncbi:alpha/beta fold hydrolase [Sphingobium sp. AN558]|uniref:alpha/beta fold hydrolase n=1 Tax=Sphingobium sp. AN558 TaxID=3133442 RepID=UPI0030C0456F
MPEGVVLLHGFGGMPVQMALLGRRLRRTGYAIINPHYSSWHWPVERIVDDLAPRFARFADQVSTIHFVGHSMGGLILRAAIAHRRPDNLGRVVTLGTPHGGSELADFLYRLGMHGPFLNRAGRLLRSARRPGVTAMLGAVDYPLGVIAGNRPLSPSLAGLLLQSPHDGLVSVAATHIEGQTDHLVLPVDHMTMIYSGTVARQIIHFLADRQFLRA